VYSASRWLTMPKHVAGGKVLIKLCLDLFIYCFAFRSVITREYKRVKSITQFILYTIKQHIVRATRFDLHRSKNYLYFNALWDPQCTEIYIFLGSVSQRVWRWPSECRNMSQDSHVLLCDLDHMTWVDQVFNPAMVWGSTQLRFSYHARSIRHLRHEV